MAMRETQKEKEILLQVQSGTGSRFLHRVSRLKHTAWPAIATKNARQPEAVGHWDKIDQRSVERYLRRRINPSEANPLSKTVADPGSGMAELNSTNALLRRNPLSESSTVLDVPNASLNADTANTLKSKDVAVAKPLVEFSMFPLLSLSSVSTKTSVALTLVIVSVVS